MGPRRVRKESTRRARNVGSKKARAEQGGGDKNHFPYDKGEGKGRKGESIRHFFLEQSIIKKRCNWSKEDEVCGEVLFGVPERHTRGGRNF